jgi:hypothetical protein
MTGPVDDEYAERDRTVYQMRCVFCDTEHYVLAVPAISRGEAGCGQCGRIPPVFEHENEYREALGATRKRHLEERNR